MRIFNIIQMRKKALRGVKKLAQEEVGKLGLNPGLSDGNIHALSHFAFIA